MTVSPTPAKFTGEAPTAKRTSILLSTVSFKEWWAFTLFYDFNFSFFCTENAEVVELAKITDTLEGRDELIGNETVAAPESYDVAECTVRSVYPEPATVTFLLNGVEHAVDASDVNPNADGTFDASATLTLAPEGQFDGAGVSCISVAAPTAVTIQNDESYTFPVEVFCEYKMV